MTTRISLSRLAEDEGKIEDTELAEQYSEKVLNGEVGKDSDKNEKSPAVKQREKVKKVDKVCVKKIHR
jgi:hypothetical protein